MPTRLVRDGILTSERVNSLDWETEVFYRRLMSVADDYGLYDGRHVVLRSALYPLKLDQMRETSIERCLSTCEAARLVRFYEVEGKPYLQIVGFGQQKKSKPKWPLPPWETGDESTRSVTSRNGPLRSVTKTESKAKSYPKTEAETESTRPPRSSGRELPANDGEAVAFLQSEVTAGRLQLPPAEVERAGRIWFHECQGRNWNDSKGIAIADWHGALRAWALRYAGNQGRPGQSGPRRDRNQGTANDGKAGRYTLP